MPTQARTQTRQGSRNAGKLHVEDLTTDTLRRWVNELRSNGQDQEAADIEDIIAKRMSTPQTGPKPRSDARAQRDADQLNAYTYANGNMSIGRRRKVIVPALVNLGYTKEQADRIALEAPLNTSMYDKEAVAASLRYATMITPENIASLDPNTVPAAMAHDAIPMPDSAKSALANYEFNKAPIKGTAGRVAVAGKSLTQSIQNGLQPLLDRIRSLPEPMGVGGLFLVNLIFLGVVIPSNSQGYPRVQILWAALMNAVSWAKPDVPAKNQVPDSPFVKSLTDIASEGDVILGSTAAVAGAAGNIAGGIGGVLGNLPSWLIHAGTGLNVPLSSAGGPPPVNPAAIPPSLPPPVVL